MNRSIDNRTRLEILEEIRADYDKEIVARV